MKKRWDALQEWAFLCAFVCIEEAKDWPLPWLALRMLNLYESFDAICPKKAVASDNQHHNAFIILHLC